MKKLVLTFTFLGVISACAPQNEQAFHTSTSAAASSLVPSRWNANVFPLHLGISSDFSNDEAQAISDMGVQWSSSLNDQEQFFDTTATITPKNTTNLNSFQDNVLGVYKMQQWPEAFPSTALAVTQIFGNKKNIGSSNEYIQITHADILVNYANFSFSTDYGFGYDLQTVILHEMGHFLGLYHDNSSVDESIMYPTISRFNTNRAPKDKDIHNVEYKYNLDDTTAVAAASREYMIPQQKIEEQGPSIPVVIVFEIHADGSEKVYFQAKKKK